MNAMKFALILSLFVLSIISVRTDAQSADTWADPVEPFQIAGNIYYVGAKDLTAYLITSPKGHILLDSGELKMVPQITANIVKLGFKVEDVKFILNTHAHYDHAAGIAELRRITKAKFLASEADRPLLQRGGLGDPNFGDQYGFEGLTPDETFSDGKVVKLGGVKMKANVTAGHTKGCTTWTTTVKDAGKKLNVIFVCSVSSPGYSLVNNAGHPTIVEDYRKSFAFFKKFDADIFLGSHAGFFELEDKRARIGKGTNPFIDREGYKSFILESEKAFEDKLKEQSVQKPSVQKPAR